MTREEALQLTNEISLMLQSKKCTISELYSITINLLARGLTFYKKSTGDNDLLNEFLEDLNNDILKAVKYYEMKNSKGAIQ